MDWYCYLCHTRWSFEPCPMCAGCGADPRYRVYVPVNESSQSNSMRNSGSFVPDPRTRRISTQKESDEGLGFTSSIGCTGEGLAPLQPVSSVQRLNRRPGPLFQPKPPKQGEGQPGSSAKHRLESAPVHEQLSREVSQVPVASQPPIEPKLSREYYRKFSDRTFKQPKKASTPDEMSPERLSNSPVEQMKVSRGHIPQRLPESQWVQQSEKLNVTQSDNQNLDGRIELLAEVRSQPETQSAETTAGSRIMTTGQAEQELQKHKRMLNREYRERLLFQRQEMEWDWEGRVEELTAQITEQVMEQRLPDHHVAEVDERLLHTDQHPTHRPRTSGTNDTSLASTHTDSQRHQDVSRMSYKRARFESELRPELEDEGSYVEMDYDISDRLGVNDDTDHHPCQRPDHGTSAGVSGNADLSKHRESQHDEPESDIGFIDEKPVVTDRQRQSRRDAETIWGMMLPAWNINPEERKTIQRWLLLVFENGRKLDDVIEIIDRHVVGLLTSMPAYPRPCLVARLANQAAGPGGSTMVSCPYCKRYPGKRICCWAEFAPCVASSFAARVGDIIPTENRGREWNRNAHPWTVRLGLKDVRWILRKRKASALDPDVIDFEIGGTKI